MKASDIFKDIDEVKEFVKRFEGKVSDDDYKLLLLYFGLLENEAEAEIVELNGEEVKIDKYIADFIVYLNESRVKTLASCSGLRSEHENSTRKPNTAYLALEYSDWMNKELKYLKVDGVKVKVDECYFKPAIIITIGDTDEHMGDELMKEKWEEVRSFLVACIEIG